jgi:hypothetical protein
MRPSVLALLLTSAVGVGCLVNNRSDSLKCSTQADCDSPRVCEAGYCVIDDDACPSLCNGGCDVNASPPTCIVNGGGGDNVHCPDGHHCDITCTDTACGNVDCTDAASCTIHCTGTAACEDITCGSAECEITCAGTSACGDVTCGNQAGGTKEGQCHVSCSGTSGCGDVTCSNACDCVIDGCTGSSDCGALSCPRVQGTYCTESGANGEPCTDANSGCSC